MAVYTAVSFMPVVCNPETVQLLQSIMKALQYLMWENGHMSVKVLEAVHHVYKKADAHSLYLLAPVCTPNYLTYCPVTSW